MICPKPQGRVQQAMQKECTKWEWLQEPLHPTEPICKMEMHTALTPSLLHTEMPTQLDHSCFSVFVFCWGTIIAGKRWHFPQLQFDIFSAFISTQADKVKKLSFSEPTFLCSDTDCGMLMKRQQFCLSLPCSHSKHPNLSYLIWGEYRKDWEIMVQHEVIWFPEEKQASTRCAVPLLLSRTSGSQSVSTAVRKHGNYNVFFPGRS